MYVHVRTHVHTQCNCIRSIGSSNLRLSLWLWPSSALLSMPYIVASYCNIKPWRRHVFWISMENHWVRLFTNPLHGMLADWLAWQSQLETSLQKVGTR